MKTPLDPRHLRRENTVKALFQYSYSKDIGEDELAKQIVEQKNQVDEIIQKSAPEWPLEKLNRIDLAILRLSIYELIQGKQPPKVVMDEAVELAKSFGAESSPRFINGALGAAADVIGKS